METKQLLEKTERGRHFCRPRYTIRKVLPEDLPELKACHDKVLEVRYPDDFFFKASHACEGIVGWVAVAGEEDREQKQIVGFITIQQQNSPDAFWVEEKIIYVLTMGVLESWRHGGIATALLNEVKKSVYCSGKSIYLHTIDYNTRAIKFYMKNSFRCIRRLQDFYVLESGGVHDGLLFTCVTDAGDSEARCIPDIFWNFLAKVNHFISFV